MIKSLISISALLVATSLLIACTGVGAVVAEPTVLRFVRPAPGEVGPTWVEGYEQLIDARHPDGVASVSYTITNQKKDQGSVSKRDAVTGYFHWPRRYKSSSTREVTLQMTTKTGEVIKAKPVNVTYKFGVRDHVGFINLNDKADVKAGSDLYVAVDCTTSVGASHQDKAKVDSDGIAWVALVVDGVEQPRSKSSRSFGFYVFRTTLTQGEHVIGIVAEDTKGGALKGPVITVKAE